MGGVLVLQSAYDGIAIGVIYALFAMSFGLVLNTRRIWHFAHGSVYAVAGFAIYDLMSGPKLPLWATLLLAIAISIAVGVVIEVFGYQVLERRGSRAMSSFIYSLVAATFIQGALTLFFTTSIHNFPIQLNLTHLTIGQLVLTHWSIETIAVGGLIIVALLLFVERSEFGRVITAVATNPELAETLGVNRRSVYVLVMAIASLVLVPTVFLLGLNTGVYPGMGFEILLIGISANIVGGLGSLRGAVLGGLVIGVAVNVATVWIPAEWQNVVAFALMFLFIVIRPSGLFGVKVRTTGV